MDTERRGESINQRQPWAQSPLNCGELLLVDARESGKLMLGDVPRATQPAQIWTKIFKH